MAGETTEEAAAADELSAAHQDGRLDDERSGLVDGFVGVRM